MRRKNCKRKSLLRTIAVIMAGIIAMTNAISIYAISPDEDIILQENLLELGELSADIETQNIGEEETLEMSEEITEEETLEISEKTTEAVEELLVIEAVSTNLPQKIKPITELPDYLEYKAISTKEELIDCFANGYGFGDKYYLTNDIDLAGQEWVPLGMMSQYGGNYFRGVLDGQGHAIKNMTSSTGNCGLFYAFENAEIRNLVIENINFVKQAGEEGGSASALVSGGSNTSSAIVENVYASGIIKGYSSAAGIVVGGGESDFSYCINAVDIETEYDCAGIANNVGPETSFTDCTNIGNITSIGRGAGGISDSYRSDTSFVRCVNKGSIYGKETAAGISARGLTYGKESFEKAKITGCINAGSIEGGDAAGIIGRSGNAGYDFDFTISDCSNSGGIVAHGSNGFGGYSGGIIGYIQDGKIINCSNSGTITSGFIAGGIAAKVGVSHSNPSEEIGIIIENCHNSGLIKKEKNNSSGGYLGGIAGDIAVIHASISGCTNSIDISVSDQACVGGIVARLNPLRYYGSEALKNDPDITIRNCKNSGNLKGYDFAGGIIGNTAGYNYIPNRYIVTNCINEGTIENGAGIIGSCTNSSNISDAVDGFSMQINGCTNNGNISGYNGSGIIIEGQFFELLDCTNNGDIFLEGKSTYTGLPNPERLNEVGKTGGLAGDVKSVINCTNNGDITALSVKEGALTAGIAAKAAQAENCINNGNVYVSLDEEEWNGYISYLNYAGGIVGYGSISELRNGVLYSDVDYAVITDCMNNGSISGVGACGGIAGGYCTIDRCGNKGNVTGTTRTGGIAGECAKVRESYNTGNVTSAQGYDANRSVVTGGITGYVTYKDYIENCYNTGDIETLRNPEVVFGNGKDFERGALMAGGIAGFLSIYPYGDDICISIKNNYSSGTVFSGKGYGGYLRAGGIMGTKIASDYGNGGVVIPIIGNAGLNSSVQTMLIENPGPYDGIFGDILQDIADGIGPDLDGPNRQQYDNILRTDGPPSSSPLGVTRVEPHLLTGDEEFKKIGWDFDNIWKIAPRGGLPVLRWQDVEEGPELKPSSEGKSYIMRGETGSLHWGIYQTPTSNGDLIYSLRISGQGKMPNYMRGEQPWKDYADRISIIEVGAGVTSVGSYAFSDFKKNNIYTMGFHDVKSIYTGAFAGSSGLVDLKLSRRDCIINDDPIGAGDGAIGSMVFEDCSKLTITCYRDSNVHKYAKENGIPVEFITYVRKTYLLGETFNSSLDSYAINGDHKSSDFNPELAHMMMLLANAAYNKSTVKRGLEELGLTVSQHLYEDYMSNTAAYSVGSKILENGKRIVTIVIRGSYTTDDWINDFNIPMIVPGPTEYQGFTLIPAMIIKTLSDARLLDTDNVYFITGHSRGAAGGNLLAKRLISTYGVSGSNVFAYNFACPDTAMDYDQNWNPDGKYNSIFNISNAEDMVSIVPGNAGQVISAAHAPGLKWNKYGNSMWFSENWNDPAKNGKMAGFAAHDPALYVKIMSYREYMMQPYKTREAMVQNLENIKAKEREGKFLGLFCPVDIELKDKSTGNILLAVKGAETIRNEKTPDDMFAITMEEDDGSYAKAVYIPAGVDIDVKLKGTDNGKMRYVISDFDLLLGAGVNNKEFNNVKLSPGKQMISNISLNSEEVGNATLKVVDDAGKPLKEVGTDGVEKDLETDNEDDYEGGNEDEGNNDDEDNSEENAEMSISEVDDCVYTGKAYKPEVIVKHNGEELTLNKDYTISYKNNTNANPVDSEGKLITGGIDDEFNEKLPTIIIKGKGNYQSEVRMNFNIIPYTLDARDVVYSVTDYVIAKTNAVTAVKASLSAGSKKLKAGKDYDAVLKNNSNTNAVYPGLKVPKGESGVYSLTITGKGNYSGTLNSVITITSESSILEMNKATVKLDKIAYEGKAITAEDIKSKITSVKIGGVTLSPDDFEVFVNTGSITAAGKYAITIRGKDSEKIGGSKTLGVVVEGIAISKAEVSFNADTVFDRSKLGRNGMKVEIKSGDTTKLLEEGTDYIVKSIKNDLKAGKATVEIEGKGIYKGIKRSTYTIYPRELKAGDGFTLTPIETQVYQKSGAMPDVEIKYQGVKLTKGTDYTLSYKDNKKTGTGYVTVTGKGNYKGQIKDLTYTIEAASFEASDVTVQVKDVVYNTKNPAKYQSVPVVYDGNGKKLTANKDYLKTVKYYSYDGEFDGDYSSSALAGHKGAELKGDPKPAAGSRIIVEVSSVDGGNYTGSVYGIYRVTANSISKAKIEFSTKMYTGKEIKLAAKDVKEAVINRTTPLKLGEDFEIVEGSYANNIKTGTAKVTVRGLDNYGGTKVVKFKITSKNIIWWKK